MTSIYKRIALALLIVVLDMTVFFVPLTAFLAAYIIIIRPKWLVKFVVNLYGLSSKDAKLKDISDVVSLERTVKRNEVERKATETMRSHAIQANKSKFMQKLEKAAAEKGLAENDNFGNPEVTEPKKKKKKFYYPSKPKHSEE